MTEQYRWRNPITDIAYLNEEFDYDSDQRDSWRYWLNVLDTQVREVEKHLEVGEFEEMTDEWADVILVATAALQHCSELDVEDHLYLRMRDIESRVDEVVETYGEDGTKDV